MKSFLKILEGFFGTYCTYNIYLFLMCDLNCTWNDFFVPAWGQPISGASRIQLHNAKSNYDK